MGGRGRSAGGKRTDVPWIDVVLTEAPTITPKTGEGPVTTSLERHLEKLLKVQRSDPRPALLYFHWPHDEKAQPTREGKSSLRQCTVMEDEQVSRWANLYRCFVVDVPASDAKIAERLGADRKGPSFAVVNAKLEVVARSGSSFAPKEIQAFLQKTVVENTPEYWKHVQERIAEQEENFRQAQSLEKQGKLQDALDTLLKIRRSPVRVGPNWDEAVDTARRLEQELGAK